MEALAYTIRKLVFHLLLFFELDEFNFEDIQIGKDLNSLLDDAEEQPDRPCFIQPPMIISPFSFLNPFFREPMLYPVINRFIVG